jgi:L-fuconolactonase
MVVEVARRWPSLSLVVDHAGLDVLPDTDADHRLDGWPTVLRLADYPQVALKVSGLPEVTPPTEDPPFPTAQGLLEELVARFGSNRLLWGSNYPPVTRRCSLPEALGWVKDGCPFLTDSQRKDVLGRTALSVFGLPWTAGKPCADASQHA